ncbi:hypothetical protein J4E80_007424 [Alternaria sp. BMP 0032]|nr:hypothetical protein J4E80_007424 [Alternaria sp. BMP 0032]
MINKCLVSRRNQIEADILGDDARGSMEVLIEVMVAVSQTLEVLCIKEAGTDLGCFKYLAPIKSLVHFNQMKYLQIPIKGASGQDLVSRKRIEEMLPDRLEQLRLSGLSEADERRIDLPDDDPEMIRRLIAYLYLGDYDPTDDIGIAAFEQLKQYDLNTAAAPAHHLRRDVWGSSQPHDQCACLALNLKNVEQPELKVEQQKKASQYVSHRKPDNSIEVTNPLAIHASMYAIADKYQVKGLSRLAKTKFRDSLDHHVDSEDFIAAVQLTYSNTPETNRGLRDEIVQAFRTYFKVDITELPGLESKLDTIDELAFLLLKSWPRKMESASPQKFVSSAGAAHTASHLVITAGPPTSGSNAISASSNAPVTTTGFASYAHTPGATTSSTPATGSLFVSLPPRASGGFASFSSTASSTGNAGSSQPALPFGSRA